MSRELNCIVRGTKSSMLPRAMPYMTKGLSYGMIAYARPIAAKAARTEPAIVAESLGVRFLTIYAMP